MTRWRRLARWMSLIGCACVFGLGGFGCAPARPEGQTPGLQYYVAARESARAGKTDDAIPLLEKAIAVNPNLRMARTMLADIYRTKGDYKRAAVQYEAATNLDAYSVSNHYNLGLSYQFLNRFQEAATAYLKALELNPRDVNSNMNLGTVYLALGNFSSATAYLKRATQLAPTNAQAWSNLGVAMDAQGNAAEAEATYRRALELDSNNVTTMQNLAQNLLSQHRPDQALAIMEQAVARDDSPSAHKRYGDAFAMAKEYEHAIAQYDIALKGDSRYLPALNEKGFTLIQQYIDGLQLNDQLRLTAMSLWRNSLQINPNQPRIVDALRRWENPGLFVK